MTLSEAMTKAKELGYKYVAVDKYGDIYAYIRRPIIVGDYWISSRDEFRLGQYHGDFRWNETLRQV